MQSYRITRASIHVLSLVVDSYFYDRQRELISSRLGQAIAKHNSQCEERDELDQAMAEGTLTMLQGYLLPKKPPLDRIRSTDTTQGHEADTILISLVRTQAVGFLANDRRANVALTRSKGKMIIVGNLDFFLKTKARNTLFGRFIRGKNETWSCRFLLI